MGLPTSLSRGKRDESTPEKTGKIRRKSKKPVEEEINSLPPIHHLRLDVKLNLYGSTVKTNDNPFKSTMASITSNRLKKDSNYLIQGKKLER